MNELNRMGSEFGPPIIELNRHSAFALARMEQRERFMRAYPEYWVNLEGIPIDRFSGECTCRPILIHEIQTIIVGGEGDCPVHGFGPGG